MDVGRAAGSVTLYYMLDSPEGKGGGPGGNGGPQTPLPLRAFTPAVLVSPEPFWLQHQVGAPEIGAL